MCVMCYVIETLGTKGLVTMNDQIMILGIDPKFGLSILNSNIPRFLAVYPFSKIFSNRLI